MIMMRIALDGNTCGALHRAEIKAADPNADPVEAFARRSVQSPRRAAVLPRTLPPTLLTLDCCIALTIMVWRVHSRSRLRRLGQIIHTAAQVRESEAAGLWRIARFLEAAVTEAGLLAQAECGRHCVHNVG